MKKAVILFSGGLDSTTCLAFAQSQGFECYPLSFHYGQRHNSELNAAKKISQQLGLIHKIIELPLTDLGGSALTDTTLDVPDYTGSTEIPITYVPARNTIFLSFALAYAEVIEAHDLFIGVSAIDYSHYPDCRPEFIAAFQHLATLATKTGAEGSPFTIHTPLQHLSKADTVRLGASLGVDYSSTVSCYQADDKGQACETCDSCTLRKKGFLESGIPDPTHYRSHISVKR